MNLNDLEIVQEGTGRLAITEKIPKNLEQYLLPGALAFCMEGDGIRALFQVLPGNGFRVWFSRYWTTKKVVLKARGSMSVLELRMSWLNQIKGSWEKIVQAEVPELCYQFGFVPHTITRAEFEARKEYQTLDVHYDLDFFDSVGMNYKMFQQFIALVLKNEPAELYAAAKQCPVLMLEAANAILRNTYSLQGRNKILDNCVSNILVAVLEDIDPEGLVVPALTPSQYESVRHAKYLIEEKFPDYPGNRALAQEVHLSLTYLMFGFKAVFRVSPYEYYNQLRINRSTHLLKRGNSIKDVAYELQYQSDRSFSRAFKKAINMLPKEYQQWFR